MLEQYDKVTRLCFFSFAGHARQYYIELCLVHLDLYVATRPLLESEKHAQKYMEDQHRMRRFLRLELRQWLRECAHLAKYGHSRHQQPEFVKDSVAPVLADRIVNDNFEVILRVYRSRKSSFFNRGGALKRAEAELNERFKNPKRYRKEGILYCDQKR